jgi:NADPH:quinone reductase
MSVPQTMRAVVVHETGDASVMRMENVPVPALTTGAALVRVEAAGVNFIDVYKRTGAYRIPLPGGLGEEGAGVIVALADDVADVNIGDRVAWANVLSSYAEYVVVPAAKLVPVPGSVETRAAAGVMLQGMTAHYLATSTYPLSSGNRCLVHAAAGGVGLLLVQIAKRCGAWVVGTAGSAEKAELARAAGADEVIVYTQQDFVTEVRRMTGGGGVDVVYDSVGRSTFLGGFDVLKPRGMLVLFGQSSGAVAPIDPQLLNQKGSLFLTRPTLAAYVATRDELLARAGDLFTWISRGELDVRIGAEFALAEVAEAHRALEGRRTTGKVVLIP